MARLNIKANTSQSDRLWRVKLMGTYISLFILAKTSELAIRKAVNFASKKWPGSDLEIDELEYEGTIDVF